MDKKRKLFNPRAELIADAALKMRTLGVGAHEALEIAQAEGRTCQAGTLGYAMREYYMGVSDTGLSRLIKATERAGQ